MQACTRNVYKCTRRFAFPIAIITNDRAQRGQVAGVAAGEVDS